MGWIRHAFAVDPPGPAEPTEAQRAPVDWFCRQVAKRRLTTPGLIALEMTRPLNFVASQAMHVADPAIWAIAKQQTHERYKQLTGFLERRGSIEYICRRIEHFEAEFQTQQRKTRAGATPTENETDEGSG